jgi:type IV pilus assembly protein PilM
MAIPFLENTSRKKRDQVLAVDLGTRMTKAVHLQRRGDELALCGYALMDAPIFDRSISAELLAEHLKTVAQTLGAKTKMVSLTVGVNDALVRAVDLPHIPLDDMRMVLRNNSRHYLQQDMSNYVFDCHIIPTWQQLKGEAAGANSQQGLQKQRVLVAGVRKQFAEEMVDGIKSAGLVADQLVPSLLGPVNAFEFSQPEVFKSEAVALVDIGFKSSSICILDMGELVLNRVVNIGGDRFTISLSESMNISYAEAEGIKVGMPSEVQPTLESIMSSLGRELRASIDFYEHQHDRTVHRVFVTGGTSRSEIIMRLLQTELMVDCKTWDPSGALRMELSPEKSAEIEQVGAQLTVAIGTGVAAL